MCSFRASAGSAAPRPGPGSAREERPEFPGHAFWVAAIVGPGCPDPASSTITHIQDRPSGRRGRSPAQHSISRQQPKPNWRICARRLPHAQSGNRTRVGDRRVAGDPVVHVPLQPPRRRLVDGCAPGSRSRNCPRSAGRGSPPGHLGAGPRPKACLPNIGPIDPIGPMGSNGPGSDSARAQRRPGHFLPADGAGAPL